MAKARRKGKESEPSRPRTHLADAELTLEAIRRGSAGALVANTLIGPETSTPQIHDQAFRQLMLQMNDGAAFISAEGLITFCNYRLGMMVGHIPWKLIGLPISALVAVTDLDVFEKLLTRVPIGPARGELQFKCKDGSLIPVQISLKAIPGEQPPNVCLVATDLTGRKLAEKGRLRQAGQYGRILGTTPDGFLHIDSQGNLLDVNPNYCRMSGYSRRELLKMRLADIEARETPQEVLRHLQQIVSSQFRRFETQHRRKNGTVLDVEVSGSYFPTTGEILTFVRDISDRKRAAEELEKRVAERTRELSAANQELETFNYAIAHDLKAPLRHISGFTDLLTKELTPYMNESSRRYVEAVHSGVASMQQLIEGLLRFAQSARQELRKDRCDLTGLAEEVIGDLKAQTDGREIKWRVAELPVVECDRILLKQVLVNLLSNAVKFTQTRKPAVIEIGQTFAAGGPAIFVRDNGVGFDRKHAGTLFGLFQRFHTKSEFEGTGVGLAIVQRIIRRHGGRVWAESEPNKGATLYVGFPPPKIEAQAKAQEARDLRSE